VTAGCARSSTWVEVAGVAGSGKSTLTHTLGARAGACRVAESLHTRRPAHWPYVLRAVPSVGRVAWMSARAHSQLTWDEVKFVIYIGQWERFLRAQRANGHGATILDQGPVFALARLLWTEKPLTRTRRFEAWVEEMLDQWSRALAAIVWLDAPTGVLLERINGRAQEHEAKRASASAAADLVRRHRAAYDRLFAVIERLGRPRVLTFDTSVASESAIADAVAGSIGFGDGIRGVPGMAGRPAPQRPRREVVL
jgi:deoxyadenosine/deoxycytidine kinase